MTMRQQYNYSHNNNNMQLEPSYPISLFGGPSRTSAATTNKRDHRLAIQTDHVAAVASSRLAAAGLLYHHNQNKPRDGMMSESLLRVLYEQQTRQRQEQLLNPILLELAKGATQQRNSIMSSSAASSLVSPVAAAPPRVLLADPNTFSPPPQAAPEPVDVVTVPCRARGMPQDHKFKTAHFKIPKDVKHGQELFCSYPACRDGGVKFCFCTHCRIPVAKRNFRIRHHHCDMAPPAPSIAEDSSTHTSTTLPVSTAPPTAQATSAVVPTPATSTQAQLATLILQSSLSQQPLISPSTASSTQANIDFLRELCFHQTLSSPGNQHQHQHLLPTSAQATNDIMVALTRQPVATVITVTNNSSGAAPILNNNNNNNIQQQHAPPTTETTSTVMLPCRARGMPSDHQFAQAHFVVPPNIQHGDELVCSYPACRDAGVKFCFCTHCRIPVAKRNFRIRHNHCEFVPPLAIHNYELSPQMKRTTNGALQTKKPAAAAATSISASDSNSDPMPSRRCCHRDHHDASTAPHKNNKRKRHHSRTVTLPTPPTTESQT